MLPCFNIRMQIRVYVGMGCHVVPFLMKRSLQVEYCTRILGMSLYLVFKFSCSFNHLSFRLDCEEPLHSMPEFGLLVLDLVNFCLTVYSNQSKLVDANISF